MGPLVAGERIGVRAMAPPRRGDGCQPCPRRPRASGRRTGRRDRRRSPGGRPCRTALVADPGRNQHGVARPHGDASRRPRRRIAPPPSPPRCRGLRARWSGSDGRDRCRSASPSPQPCRRNRASKAVAGSPAAGIDRAGIDYERQGVVGNVPVVVEHDRLALACPRLPRHPAPAGRCSLTGGSAAVKRMRRPDVAVREATA